MQLPLQVTFRKMEHSDAIEASIKEKAAKLERFYDHIMSCRVIVESHHKHHHQGNLYHVRIDVKVPDQELVASREPDQHHAHEDVYVAIRDAFDAIHRQLEHYVTSRRGDIKSHDVTPHGHISQLVPEENYGMIKTSDGREIYFHRNSLIDYPFDQLAVGANVHFSEEMGEKGPQASSVHIEGKHHVVG